VFDESHTQSVSLLDLAPQIWEDYLSEEAWGDHWAVLLGIISSADDEVDLNLA
jgi:hypothetical protein